MPQLAAAAWASFSAAAAAAGASATAALTAAGLSAATAATIGGVIGVVSTAMNVIGGVMSVASALGLGQRQPELQSTWSRTQLSIEAAPGMRVAVGETAVAGILRANFQTGRKKEIFSEVIALSSAGPIGAIHGPIIERTLYSVNTSGSGLTLGSCSYAPNDMWVYRNLGAWDQASLAPWPGHGSISQPPGWTSNHRGLGCAHVFAVYRENPEAFPKGKPVPLWRVSGHTNVIDPRTGTTASPEARDLAACWEYTWRLGLKTPTGEPLINAGIPLGGYHKTVEQLDTAAYAAWANRCEELGLKVSGQIDLTDDDPEAVSRAFLQAGCATYVLKGGRDSVIYQAPKVSVGTITEADLMGPVSVKTSPEIRDRPNSIVPKFVSEAHGFEMVPGSAITNAAYQTEDGGLREAELTLPMVLGEEQAAIVAAYQLIQSRERLYVQGSFHPRVLAFAPGDAITLNLPRLGISNVKCVIEGRAIGKSGAITLAMRSETDAKHDWATGQTTVAPDLTIPQLATGDAPIPEAGQWTATAATITSSGTTIPIIRVSGSSSDYPQGSAVVLRYRLAASGSPWLGEYTLGMDATIAELDTVTPGTAYVVGVAYRNGYGREGSILELPSVTTGTLVAGTYAPQPANLLPGAGPFIVPGDPDIGWLGPPGERWEIVESSAALLGQAMWQRALDGAAWDELLSPLMTFKAGETISATATLGRLGTWTAGDVGAAVLFFDSNQNLIGEPSVIGWALDGTALGSGAFEVTREGVVTPTGTVGARFSLGVARGTGTGWAAGWRFKVNRGPTSAPWSDEATVAWMWRSRIGLNILDANSAIVPQEQLLNTLVPRFEGASAATIRADFRGAVLAGQLPRVLVVRLMRGSENISALVAWDATATNATASVTGGEVVVTGCTANGSVSVMATLDGVEYRHVIDLTLARDAPQARIEGPSATSVQADFRGVPLAGQLPRALTVRLSRGDDDVSALAIWSASTLGCTATVSDGAVSITDVAGTGSINVTAELNGVEYRHNIEVLKLNAAPPVTGGGGATRAVDTTIDPTGSTTLVTVGGSPTPLTVRAGAAGQIVFSAAFTFTTAATSNTSAAMRIRYRAVGSGTWLWAAAEVSSTVPARGGTEPELGEIDAGTTLTGLTSGTDYECTLEARVPSGVTVFFDGPFAVEAS